MGAETTVYVRVLKTHEEWIEVSAVTLDEAKFEASKLPNVAAVLDAHYQLRGDIS
jgi:hypothetical protein